MFQSIARTERFVGDDVRSLLFAQVRELESPRAFCNIPSMSEPKQPLDESIWCAYGPEKEAWKKHGNYFTAEELKKMQEDFRDLVIRPVARKVYVVE